MQAIGEGERTLEFYHLSHVGRLLPRNPDKTKKILGVYIRKGGRFPLIAEVGPGTDSLFPTTLNLCNYMICLMAH